MDKTDTSLNTLEALWARHPEATTLGELVALVPEAAALAEQIFASGLEALLEVLVDSPAVAMSLACRYGQCTFKVTIEKWGKAGSSGITSNGHRTKGTAKWRNGGLRRMPRRWMPITRR